RPHRMPRVADELDGPLPARPFSDAGYPPAVPGLRRSDDRAGQGGPACESSGKIVRAGLSLRIGRIHAVDDKDRADAAPFGDRVMNEVRARSHPDRDHVSKRGRDRTQRQDCPPGYGVRGEAARMVAGETPDGGVDAVRADEGSCLELTAAGFEGDAAVPGA